MQTLNEPKKIKCNYDEKIKKILKKEFGITSKQIVKIDTINVLFKIEKTYVICFYNETMDALFGFLEYNNKKDALEKFQQLQPKYKYIFKENSSNFRSNRSYGFALNDNFYTCF